MTKHKISIGFGFVCYARMLLHCHSERMTIAAFVNEAVACELDRLDVVVPTAAQAQTVMADHYRKVPVHEIAADQTKAKVARRVSVVGLLSARWTPKHESRRT